jgi:drug/metabolite transporter (DMT)-like permease
VKQYLSTFIVRVLGSIIGFIIKLFVIKLISLSKAVIIIYNPFISSIQTYFIIGELLNYKNIASLTLSTIGVVLLRDLFNS